MVFELRPSARLLQTLWVLHGLAAVAAWLNSLPYGVRISLCLLVVLSGLHYQRQVRGPLVKLLQVRTDGSWLLTLSDGREVEGVLLGHSRVTRRFVLLGLRSEAGEQSILILPDSLPVEDFRKLRLAVRTATVSESKTENTGI